MQNSPRQSVAQPLTRAECLRLLETEDFGRLAIIQGEMPAIFPINYVMHGDQVLLRTGPGSKLWHGPGPAAFEIDSVSHEQRSGWSVVAAGWLEIVAETEATLLRDLYEGQLQPWAAGSKANFMKLVPGLITGRRIEAAAATT